MKGRAGSGNCGSLLYFSIHFKWAFQYKFHIKSNSWDTTPSTFIIRVAMHSMKNINKNIKSRAGKKISQPAEKRIKPCTYYVYIGSWNNSKKGATVNSQFRRIYICTSSEAHPRRESYCPGVQPTVRHWYNKIIYNPPPLPSFIVFLFKNFRF